MRAAAAAAPWRALDLWRTVAGLVVVLGGAAALLAALDAVPAWLSGEPRDVRRVASLEEAEQRLHARLLLPGYFPEAIEFPPAAVRVRGGPAPGAALVFDGRKGGVHMVLAQAARPGPIPDRLLPDVNVLSASPIAIGRQQGTLRRFVGADGEVWRELEWRVGGRQLILRSRGTVEEMLRMARTTGEAP